MYTEMKSKEAVKKCMDSLFSDVLHDVNAFFNDPVIMKKLDTNDFDFIYANWMQTTQWAPWVLTGMFYLADIDPFPYMNTIIESTFSYLLPITKITIPTNVKQFKGGAFESAPITKLFYDGTLSQFREIKIDKNWCVNSPIKSIICRNGKLDVYEV